MSALRNIPRLLAALLLAAVAGACSRKTDDAARPTVAVSFGPQAWIIDQIAGDDFDVLVLLPPGADPESYEPSMADMKTLARASEWYTMDSEGFEENLRKRIASNFPGLNVSDVSRGITRIEDIHSHNGSGHRSGLHSHSHSESKDPHILTSVRNARIMADTIAARLSALMPNNAARYSEANSRLQQRLAMLDDSIKAVYSSPAAHKAFLIAHPSLSYMARDYGLTQISLEEGGKEMSPAEMANRLEEAKLQGVAVMYVESEHPAQGLQDMAAQMGLKTVAISLNSRDWPQQIRKVAGL